VDSWLTFCGAPYVLNYPENPTRLFLRKSVKKFKKLARQMGVHRWLGEVSVVPPSEYQARLTAIVRLARERSPGVHICLIATPPSLIEDRNSRIENYNAMLKQVGMDHHCAFVDGYALFRDRAELFLDPVHLNKDAHAMLAQSCLEALRLG
jgi:lysophospholipase L1-like esterase